MRNKKTKQVERRSNVRIPMNIGATLNLPNGFTLAGKTKNISFGGTFVRFDQIPVVNPGDYFNLELFARIKFTVRCIHLHQDGLGFQFDFILIKYYESFKKMMLQHAPDPERLIKELGRQTQRNELER